jgi:hypothetical protein
LIADASRLFGLGFVLKQEVESDIWKMVQAGSRFLSDAETRYAMIELELLATAWAAKKCALFIEGLLRDRLEIWTDHQLLVPILSKCSLPEIDNKQLQRLRMKLDHLQFTVKWVKGKDNVEADKLSLAPCAKARADDELDESVAVAKAVISSIQQDPPLRDELLLELKKFADEDEEYQALQRLVVVGFLSSKDNLGENLAKYWPVRFELSLDMDGFVMRGDRLVMPKGLRKTYLQRLLAMHQGADKMLSRARKSIWWPFLTSDVKNMADSCLPCQEHKVSNPKEGFFHHEQPIFPFQFVHMDLASYEGCHFLICVDQYSWFPHIFQCGKTATAKQVVDHVQSLISWFSIPVTSYTDGGPQFFKDGEFDKLCKGWGIQHVKSSLHHPQSNGIAEETVKDMKKIIRTTFCHRTGKLDAPSASAGLLLFRNTPLAPFDLSPAELLFGQKIRDCLPISRAAFRPEARFEVEKRRQEVFAKQRECEGSRKFCELPLLRPGQQVFIQNPQTKHWTDQGSVMEFGENHHEYLVLFDRTQKVYRRNRRYLRPQNCEPVKPPEQPVQSPQLEAENSSGQKGILKTGSPAFSPAKRCSFSEPEGGERGMMCPVESQRTVCLVALSEPLEKQRSLMILFKIQSFTPNECYCFSHIFFCCFNAF